MMHKYLIEYLQIKKGKITNAILFNSYAIRKLKFFYVKL